MLTVGQTLWGINKETGEEDTVEVVKVTEEWFRVEYKGKTGKYPLSAINTKFFTTPRNKDVIEEAEENSCANCYYRNNGECPSLANVICEEYRRKLTIPYDEIANWPEYGDVTAYRLRDKKHFK